ncbi:MAG: hypothetical protein FD165_2897, partial [Gammaproteobacteria bacterium]
GASGAVVGADVGAVVGAGIGAVVGAGIGAVVGAGIVAIDAEISISVDGGVDWVASETVVGATVFVGGDAGGVIVVVSVD